MSKLKLLVKNAAQVVQVCSNGEPFKTKEQMESVEIIDGGYVAVNQDGRIESVGKMEDLTYKDSDFDRVIDCEGKRSVVPGLIDSHTHPIFAGDRCFEFGLKLKGATYMEIHKAGGGIGYTVSQTRKATFEDLYKDFKERLDLFLRNGTTLVECKSGYGLELETELKMLKVAEKAKKEHPIDVVSTYLGAHSIPKGETLESYTKDVIENQIPRIAQEIRDGAITVDMVDVFCETGVIELEESRKILVEGSQKLGCLINFHGDELTPIKAAQMGSEIGARGISHLEFIDDEGIEMMAEKKVAGVVLPTTAYVLQIDHPPTKKMIDKGMIVAIASDYNPNVPIASMPIVMNIACVTERLSMEQVLVATTINAAYSIGKEKTHGSLEKGKQGDMVIVDSPNWQHLIYKLGVGVIWKVVKSGDVY